MQRPPSSSPADLDRLDRAILRILQSDNKTSQRDIAETVNLSPAAVQRRIKRMEETKVIEANIAVIDPVKVGHPVTLLVEVELEGERLEQLGAAKRAFASDPWVQQCFYVTGDADFILIVTVPTMADYEALTTRLFFENNNVKRFRTFVAMDRVKVGLTVPIP